MTPQELEDYYQRLYDNDTTLTGLDLGYTDLGPEEAKAMADALKENTTLTTLDLNSNNLGPEGAKAMADALKENTTLKRLDLYYNNLGPEGAKAMADALKENTTLTELYLHDNDIPPEMQKEIDTLLNFNQDIAKARAGGTNPIDASQMDLSKTQLKALNQLQIEHPEVKVLLSEQDVEENHQLVIEAQRTEIERLRAKNEQLKAEEAERERMRQIEQEQQLEIRRLRQEQEELKAKQKENADKAKEGEPRNQFTKKRPQRVRQIDNGIGIDERFKIAANNGRGWKSKDTVENTPQPRRNIRSV